MRRFVDLPPHEQFKYLQDRELGVDKLYMQAKDDLIRLTIIQKSGNIVLARRLHHNTKYAKVKAALEPLLIDALRTAKEEPMINREKMAALIKKILPNTATLTDEEMKSWVEHVRDLNPSNTAITNFSEAVLRHMIKANEDFPVKYYFDIFVDTLARKLSQGVQIELPETTE